MRGFTHYTLAPENVARGTPGSGLTTIPRSLHSLLGPIHVVQADAFTDDSIGESEFKDRTIAIQKGLHPATTDAVLGHELMHFILYDSGVVNGLSPRQVESICDAFGTWLASAMRADMVQLRLDGPEK